MTHAPGATRKLDAAVRAASTAALLLSNTDPNALFGVVEFHQEARAALAPRPVGPNKTMIIHTLRSMSIAGGTDIDRGLLECERMLWGTRWTKASVLFLTDGCGGDGRSTAARLRHSGVIIDVVGIGSDPADVNEPMLREIATNVDGQPKYRFIKDSRTLVDEYTRLAGDR